MAVHGVKWTTVSAIFRVGLQTLRIAILSRLLTPVDFGLMAMISILLGLIDAFMDLGTGNAIIQRRDTTSHQLASLYWLNLTFATAVSTFIIASTPLFSTFYAEPQLRMLLPWCAPLFLINAIGFVFRNVMQRDLNFALLARIQMIAVTIGSAVAVIFAFRGHGVFSLILAQLATAATTATLYVAFGRHSWHPTWHFDLRDLRGYINFGLYQMGERFVNYISANIDYLVIGRALGPHALGSYTLAYQLVVLPLTTINPILTSVAFPLFAKVQSDNAALRRGYLAIAKFLAFTTLPVLIGAGLTAPVLVPLVFGPKWGEAIRLVQILAFLGVLKSFANPSGSVLLAKGRVDIDFKWECFSATLNAITFAAVVHYGVAAVAISHVILVGLYFLPFVWIVCRLIDLPLRQYLLVFVRPATFVTVMASAVLLSNNILTVLIGNHIVLLLSLCLIGSTIFVLQISYFERQYIKDLWRLLAN
ncbi:MOP flippase family protein [Candidatus Methylomirabilis limnetica]|uniref:MOP flippase family protein n=1 Tax=Candidatus Methylomirabilis limnetica TaxID=2033718 RepID=UPI00137B218E|nr:MOP flippase family protein [Candidatus Methylomirabilis limnetica]